MENTVGVRFNKEAFPTIQSFITLYLTETLAANQLNDAWAGRAIAMNVDPNPRTLILPLFIPNLHSNLYNDGITESLPVMTVYVMIRFRSWINSLQLILSFKDSIFGVCVPSFLSNLLRKVWTWALDLIWCLSNVRLRFTYVESRDFHWEFGVQFVSDNIATSDAQLSLSQISQ